MIRMPKRPDLELVAQSLVDCSIAIEHFARRRGHPDPSDFLGSLALELCRQPAPIPAHHATRKYLFWLAGKRLHDYHRERASHPHETQLNGEVIAVSCQPGERRQSASMSSPQAAVDEMLQKLNPRHRDALERKLLLDQPNQEIAEALKMTRSGVRSAIYYAKTQLRNLLQAAIAPKGNSHE